MTAIRKALIIAGMHRSGTSMASSWMKACGLDMGYQLIGATPSNIPGHFEDIDIVEFHEKLLRFNNTNLYEKEGDALKYNEYFLAKARALVFLRDQLNPRQWGWKQPRATLFLHLWREVLPEGHYWFLYRDYKKVVSSLYRREFNKLSLRNSPPESTRLQQEFKARKEEISRDYLSMWTRHNQHVLEHLEKAPTEKTLICSLDFFIQNDRYLFDYFENQWGFKLHYQPLASIYQENLLIQQEINFSDKKTEERADLISQQLQEAEIKTTTLLSK